MTTKKPANSLNNGAITFELTIPKEQVAAQYQIVLQKVAATAEIKGFRKGKAPINMVESTVDKSRLYSQILDQVIPSAYTLELGKLKVNPIIDPQITPKQFEEGKDWVFTVQTASKPEVRVGDYKKYIAKALSEYKRLSAKDKHTDDAKSRQGGSHDHEGDASVTIIFDALLKESLVEVAPILVEQEAKAELSRLVKQLEQLHVTVADFAKSQKKTQDELVAEYHKTATTNLKLELILDQLVMVENPPVSPAELATLKAPKGQEAYAKYVLQKQKVIDILKAL